MKASIRKAKEAELAEIERLEVENQLRMKAYRDANRIEFFDTKPNPGPNPKQAQLLEAFIEDFIKTLGMSGGNRLGKTTILTLIGLSVMFGKFLWNDTSLLHLFPHNQPRKVRYIGQGWNDHVKAVVIPEIDKWWPKNRAVKRRGNGVITDTFWKDLKTKSTMELMSNNQQPKEHEGWSGDLILYDEPCRREIYVANARGLVDRKGKEVFAATLLEEPWIDREITKRLDTFGKPDKSVFWVTGTSYDNIGFGITEDGLDDFAKKLRPEEVESRIKGIPEYMSGLICGNFSRKYRDRGGHLCERFQVPLDWMIDIAIDVHPREKQAILFRATDSRNDRYLVDEIWDHGNGKWVAESIIRKVKYNSYRVNRIIIDPLAKGDSNNPESVYEVISRILLAEGLILETATKDKDQGIIEIKNHLMGPNNTPSLFFFDDLVRTIYEIEGWMWDKDTQKAQDKDDHMMENLYRLTLLDTKYVEPMDYLMEGETEPAHMSSRDAMTGY